MESREQQMILKAISLFAKAHEGQVRKVSGLPYFNEHSLKAALILAKYKESKCFNEIVCAILGHDAYEDTDLTFVQVAIELTPLVASLILEVTNDEEEIKRIGKKAYLMKKLPGLSNYGLVVKLLDRLINISDNPTLQYVYDTIDILNHLISVRNLTDTQMRITEDILTQCNREINQKQPLII